VFSGGFTAEEVVAVGDKESGATRTSDVQTNWRPFLPRPQDLPVYVMKLFSCTKHGTTIPKVPDYISVSELADKRWKEFSDIPGIAYI
jgi:hypothetical protein